MKSLSLKAPNDEYVYDYDYDGDLYIAILRLRVDDGASLVVVPDEKSTFIGEA